MKGGESRKEKNKKKRGRRTCNAFSLRSISAISELALKFVVVTFSSNLDATISVR